MNINDIQKEIDKLFGEHKVPAITKNLPIENMHKWSAEVANHFKLDAEEFRQSVSELFWTAGHVQLSLGYSLIARRDCAFPSGAQGQVFHEKDIPNVTNMPEIHFWYHINNSYECIYRCWERITLVIKHVCFPKNTKKMYFPDLIDEMNKDTNFNKNPYFKALQELASHRKKIADDRNEVSHRKSSPFSKINIEGKVSNVLGLNGIPLLYLDYRFDSPDEELKEIVEQYRQILPAIKTMQDFIDYIG